ncbi:putative cryptochrome [Xylariaceae sp. FL0016]|nr:putative cryptochrome [Xylariaceae sp. FL0016]
MPDKNTLIYIVRRDLRVSDNPILHRLASSSDHGFTHLLPVLIIPPHQIEVSGFLKEGTSSPYPEARSEVSQVWRCGPHRVKFIAQSIWNMKENFAKLGSNMVIRVGQHGDVIQQLVEGLNDNQFNVTSAWMIQEEGYEEERDEKSVTEACSKLGISFRAWADEKYFVDDRDVKLEDPQDLPDVFTSYRKMMEPLRERPRKTVPRPTDQSLPKTIEDAVIPPQKEPFEIPSSFEAFEEALLQPLASALPKLPELQENRSAHPFEGGEDNAQVRLDYLITSGNAQRYKSTRNGLLGIDFSTKLSAYLAQGCLTARQVHEALMAYEDGSNAKYSTAPGYSEGENEGTKSLRFELLWRDYMRLCTRKFKKRLFYRSGFRNDTSHKWKTARKDDISKSQQQPAEDVAAIIQRVFEGTTGQGLIDASQRELIHTGYTSNRARQNVASFLAKHLEIDWRYGAEWYEMILVDYDVSSNWANWQYVAGVGNDPRGEARIFNPVKQAFDYDKEGEYVRWWVPEISKLEKLENLFQPWTTPTDDWERFGLTGLALAENPVKKIEFSVEGKPKSSRRPFPRRRGQGRGGPNGNGNSNGSGQGQQPHPSGQPSQFSNEEQAMHGQRGTFQSPDGFGNGRGGYRGGRGYNGGYRGGRGYGGPRGGYRGGRGQWQQGYPQSPRAMVQPWTTPNTAQ